MFTAGMVMKCQVGGNLISRCGVGAAQRSKCWLVVGELVVFEFE